MKGKGPGQMGKTIGSQGSRVGMPETKGVPKAHPKKTGLIASFTKK